MHICIACIIDGKTREKKNNKKKKKRERLEDTNIDGRAKKRLRMIHAFDNQSNK